MAKYRNIPQATKDNILHYVNQVYDEAYELGYQHGKRQGESDIEKTQRMIEDAVESLQGLVRTSPEEFVTELKPYEEIVRCKDCEFYKKNGDLGACDIHELSIVGVGDFCSFAKRRAESEGEYVR